MIITQVTFFFTLKHVGRFLIKKINTFPHSTAEKSYEPTFFLIGDQKEHLYELVTARCDFYVRAIYSNRLWHQIKGNDVA